VANAAVVRFSAIPEFHVAVAQLAVQSNEIDQALAALKRAVELDSDDHTIAARFLADLNAWINDRRETSDQ
jgi:predicted TPR repeat methyltransferase